jgi:hypothetical protein
MRWGERIAVVESESFQTDVPLPPENVSWFSRIIYCSHELQSLWRDPNDEFFAVVKLIYRSSKVSIDLLGFQHLTSAVVGIVKNNHLLPATIGIYGDWGGGKSSLIQMVQEELDKLVCFQWFHFEVMAVD